MDRQTEERIGFWLEKDFDAQTKSEILHLKKEDPKALVDAFYTHLAFGTGGLRGVMGVGSNRMNKYTVGWASQGLANYLKKVYGQNMPLKVAIGYDSRHNSKEFARFSAEVLAANGITVYLFSNLRPTPLVSFACRYHGCQAAIMVTASHNPANYNGYKVYGSDGAQVLAPHDTGIIEEVNRLHDPADIKYASENSAPIVLMEHEEDEAYLDAISHLQITKPTNQQLSILYSSLHGTGITIIPQALNRYGFTDLHFVKAQIIPDGDFPTAKRPNPEEKAALALGIEQMMQESNDIYIATDPDADRVGVVVRHKDAAVILNGNQIACLLVHFICKRLALPAKAAFVKTIVTSELFRAIAEAHKASCFDVLTGFKYIAEKIREWESEESGYKFIFGGEESYGYLFGSYVRDKDAVVSSCLIAEAAIDAKKEGKTLVDVLYDIYDKYGYFEERLISLEFEESKAGKERLQHVMQQHRLHPPTELAGEQIVRIIDLLQEGVSDLPKSDVLIWYLAGGTKVVVRPSGTEPKAKVYVMMQEKEFINIDDAKAKVAIKAAAIQKYFL
jgi:phosphoglucomutase/phosphomannomutase